MDTPIRLCSKKATGVSWTLEFKGRESFVQHVTHGSKAKGGSLSDWIRVVGELTYTLAACVDPPAGNIPASMCSESYLCSLLGGIFSDASSASP